MKSARVKRAKVKTERFSTAKKNRAKRMTTVLMSTANEEQEIWKLKIKINTAENKARGIERVKTAKETLGIGIKRY